MKYPLSLVVAMSVLVLLVSPGLTADIYPVIPYGPAGPGGPIQHVTVYIEHDTSLDIWLDPTGPDQGNPPGFFTDALGRYCNVKNGLGGSLKYRAGVDITGDLPLLSDVYCLDPTTGMARVEVVLVIDGKFTHGSKEEIKMGGRMTLDIDLNVYPCPMEGYLVFQEGIGTHYGVLQFNGKVEYNSDGVLIGSGTGIGWVRKNK